MNIRSDEFIQTVEKLKKSNRTFNDDTLAARRTLVTYLLNDAINFTFIRNLEYLKLWDGIANVMIASIFSDVFFSNVGRENPERVQYLYEELFYKKMTDLTYENKMYQFYLPIFILLSNMDYENKGDRQYNRKMEYRFIKYMLKNPDIFIIQSKKVLLFTKSQKLKEKIYAKKLLLSLAKSNS